MLHFARVAPTPVRAPVTLNYFGTRSLSATTKIRYRFGWHLRFGQAFCDSREKKTLSPTGSCLITSDSFQGREALTESQILGIVLRFISSQICLSPFCSASRPASSGTPGITPSIQTEKPYMWFQPSWGTSTRFRSLTSIVNPAFSTNSMY